MASQIYGLFAYKYRWISKFWDGCPYFDRISCRAQRKIINTSKRVVISPRRWNFTFVRGCGIIYLHRHCIAAVPMEVNYGKDFTGQIFKFGKALSGVYIVIFPSERLSWDDEFFELPLRQAAKIRITKTVKKMRKTFFITAHLRKAYLIPNIIS